MLDGILIITMELKELDYVKNAVSLLNGMEINKRFVKIVLKKDNIIRKKNGIK